MHSLRPPDDAYRHFVRRHEKGESVNRQVYRSKLDGARYLVDGEGWLFRLDGEELLRTIDPLPVHTIRSAEVLTSLRWDSRIAVAEDGSVCAAVAETRVRFVRTKDRVASSAMDGQAVWRKMC